MDSQQRTTALRQSRAKNAKGGCVISFVTVREIAEGLPGAVEGTSYGTPAFHVGKTLFVRQHQDGESLVVRIDPDERAVRVAADPKTYSVTDHYSKLPTGSGADGKCQATGTEGIARGGVATRHDPRRRL
jgi:hypothetical protein